MAKKKTVQPMKRHHTERFRGPNLHIERYSNAKCGHIGFHVARGRSSVEVSEILADGTSSATLRHLVKLWRLPGGFEKRGYAFVQLSSHKRRLLREQSEELGIEPEEFLRRIAECVIGDRLYSAVVDGRY